MKEVILIDAGTGNLRSVQKALKVSVQMSNVRMIHGKFWPANL